MSADRHKLTDYFTLGLFASLTFALQSVAWPLSEGRDYGTYIFYYLDFLLEHPSFQTLMLYRTPISPFVLGLLLDYGGAIVTELAMGLLFVISVSLTYATGQFYSRRIGVLSAITLMFFPPFGAIFHAVSGDPIFATLLLVWVYFMKRFATSVSKRTYILHGLFVAVLFLTRPIAQTFLVFVIVPFLLGGCNFRKRFQLALVFLSVSVSIGLLWSTHNYVRYDDFTIARGSAAMIPFQRAFVVSKIVHPENGKHSAKFINLIKTELLSKEPYLSYDVNTKQLLSSGGSRVFLDLWAFSDRVWGWDSDHKELRKVGIEAVTKHPWAFAYGLARDFLYMLSGKYRHNPPLIKLPQSTSQNSQTKVSVNPKPTLSSSNSLPVPTEQQPIPGPNSLWVASNPNNSVIRNWDNIRTSGAEFVFLDPKLEHNYFLRAAKASHFPNLPVRTGNAFLSKFFNNVTRFIYPSIIVWVSIGLCGLLYRPTRLEFIDSFPFLLALGAVFITTLAANANLHYAFPFIPVFFLFGTIGFNKLLNMISDR